MGGHVSVESSELGGVKFRVSIDAERVAPTAESDLPADSVGAARACLHGKTVLVVDDEETLRWLVAEIMESCFECTVLSAGDGQEALDILANQRVDLILTDYFMPQLDGSELIDTLRARGDSRPIIALTAATIGEEREALLTVGADRVLAKPIDAETLAETVVALSERLTS